MTEPVYQGGCLCKATRFEVSGAPTNPCFCHCRSCRGAAGAPFVAWATFPADLFRVTRGELTQYPSSPKVTRGFCGSCGTAITYAHRARPSELDVTLVALDDIGAIQPECHIWVSHKLRWVVLGDELPCFVEWRGEGTSAPRKLPDIAGLLGPLLQRVSPKQRPLFVAIAERMAAERYRGWARESDDPSHRSGLLACADREEEIARRVEALDPEAAAVQAALRAGHPELEALNRSIFADRPLPEQFAIQAGAERVGASTWRAFAEHATPAAREVFLACAELEERSAALLESILDRTR